MLNLNKLTKDLNFDNVDQVIGGGKNNLNGGNTDTVLRWCPYQSTVTVADDTNNSGSGD